MYVPAHYLIPSPPLLPSPACLPSPLPFPNGWVWEGTDCCPSGPCHAYCGPHTAFFLPFPVLNPHVLQTCLPGGGRRQWVAVCPRPVLPFPCSFLPATLPHLPPCNLLGGKGGGGGGAGRPYLLCLPVEEPGGPVPCYFPHLPASLTYTCAMP